jgi:O-antigen ligase
VVVLLVWTTFPAGGVYPAVWVPAALGTMALAYFARPHVAQPGEIRWLDLSIIGGILAVLAQLLPLPAGLIGLIDPHALTVRSALSLPATLAWGVPVSIVPSDTIEAAGIFSAAVLMFLTCRQICEAGGTGRIIRAIAIIGLLGSIAAIMQSGTNKELLYGFWRPRDPGARPFGPFINRNHFATWLMMACPLVFGYLLARAPAAPDNGRAAQHFVQAAKQLGTFRVWLAAAVCLMTLAVVISASRSGIIGLAAALVASALLSRGHHVPRTARWKILQAALLGLVVVSFANFDALSARIDETFSDLQMGRGRSGIWQDATRVVRDFPLTGTGAGTFGTAVRPYQTSVPGFSIGNAHNQYLQTAAEGGALLVIPCAGSVIGFVLLLRRRLAGDSSSTVLVRAGAAAGIAAVMTQNVWETGLRMPANAMLFAILAAIAVHMPPLPSTTAHHPHSH